MQQLDWIGQPERKKAKVIRDTRESSAQEKARLCLELGELCRVIPDKLKGGGSINDVRKWKAARESALKVAGNKRASVVELQYAIKAFRGWDR